MRIYLLAIILLALIAELLQIQLASLFLLLIPVVTAVYAHFVDEIALPDYVFLLLLSIFVGIFHQMNIGSWLMISAIYLFITSILGQYWYRRRIQLGMAGLFILMFIYQLMLDIDFSGMFIVILHHLLAQVFFLINVFFSERYLYTESNHGYKIK